MMRTLALTLAFTVACAGQTPVERAAETYGYLVIATEAAADIVENPNIDTDVRRAIQVAERYSTPAAQALKTAAVAAIKTEARVSAGLATKEDLQAAYALVREALADLEAPATDLFEAVGGEK